jgi:hypothetical protein
MERFDFAKILILSVPEAVLSIYIAFLFISKSKFLPFKDDSCNRTKNIFNILLFSFSVSLVYAFLIHYMSGKAITAILSLLFSAVVMKSIY